MGSYTLHLVNLVAVYAIAVIGLHIIVGLCGQFSLAQGAFFGIGAYGLALLESRGHWPAVAAALGGAFLSAAVAAVVGVPILRLRGHYLAMATIGFGEILYLTLLNWTTLTNGPDGLRIARPFLAGAGSPAYDRAFFIVVATVVAACAMATVILGRSAFGRELRAVRDNELAAATCGIAVPRVKTAAFAAAAFFAGLAGALYGLLETYVSPDTFTFDFSIVLLTMLLVGGRYSVAGAVIGAVLLGFLPEWLRFLKDYYMLLFGALVVVSVTWMPAGIVGTFDARRRRGAA